MCDEKTNNRILNYTTDLNCGCGCIGFPNSKERNQQLEKNNSYPATDSPK
ncbi:MAG: hypothetical protein ACFFBP_19000 [Promethearchaeota archaeon]